MALRLTYWEDGNDKDTHLALREVRLKSIEEAFTLALPHNRPNRTSLITMGRTDGQSVIEKTVWERGMDWPQSPISNPLRTKSKLRIRM